METELVYALENVIDYFGEELNPAQMDQMGNVLTGVIANNLDCIDPVRIEYDDDAFERLVEYATRIAVAGKMLERLNNYKMSNNGEKLKLTFEV